MLRIAISLALCGLMLWVFTQYTLRGDTLFYRALQNSGHGLGFLLLTLMLLVLTRAKGKDDLRRLPVIAALLFALGIGIELVQHLTGRGFSASDLVMNSAGIVSACTLYFLATRKVTRKVIAALLVIAALPMLWVISEPALYVAAKFIQYPLPELNDFDSTLSMVKVSTRHSNTKVSEFTQWPSNSSKSLRVTFTRGRWPSVYFREPVAQWCAFEALVFDTYNPNGNVVTIRVRVDDPAIGYKNHSFMTVSRPLEPGANAVSVPFDELRETARERGMATFKHITGFQIFLVDNEEPVSIYFDNFRLEQTGSQVASC